MPHREGPRGNRTALVALRVMRTDAILRQECFQLFETPALGGVTEEIKVLVIVRGNGWLSHLVSPCVGSSAALRRGADRKIAGWPKKLYLRTRVLCSLIH